MANPAVTESAANYIKLPDGRRLAYSEYGDPSGRPIVYCHGGLSCRVDVEFAHNQCRQLGVRLIAPDRPGIGASDRKESRTLLSWAHDVEALARALKLAPFPVLGWSLGGPYALACGYQLKDRVTLVGTVGGVGPLDRPGAVQELGMIEDQWLLTCPPEFRWMLGLMLDGLVKLPAEMIHKSLLMHLKSQNDREVVQGFSTEQGSDFFVESMKQGSGGHLDDYAAVGAEWEFSVEEIEKPVILWQGEEDNLCPLSAARDLFRRLKNGRLETVSKAGHFLLHQNLPAIMKQLLPA